MNKVDYKKKRDAIIFPFRWFKILSRLDEAPLRAMLSAIQEYGENGIEPNFSGLLACIWIEIKAQMDGEW